jgi:vitamin B12/bleomycin/antimicrobial peptide transport system ATP-binding/permease protein
MPQLQAVPAQTGTAEIITATPQPSALARFRGLVGRYWFEEKASEAWLLTIAVISLVLITLAVQIGINRWNRFFFDALDRHDGTSLYQGVALLIALALSAAAAAVALVHVRMRLQVRWRQWVTRRLIRLWLADRRFYQLTIVDGEGTNPEYRIADDTRMATEPFVDFVIGLVNAALTALAFIGILWTVGGALDVTVAGSPWHIPGYIVFAAVIYSAIASFATYRISRPLIKRVDEKNDGEARLRYELTRVRESAETIALIGGDKDEEKRLSETFSDLAARWIRVIAQQARMTWIINGNSVFAPLVPLLLGAPKYLSGSLSLGALMQIAAAFVQVQVALNWLVENAIRLAEWKASAQRVGELLAALAALDDEIGEDAGTTIVLGDSTDENVHILDLSIAQRTGKLMIKDADVVIAPGEKVLVRGESGTGKSTLIRAMAGLWPWGSGEILKPKHARIAFMPQRPYIPLGTLRNALEYPAGGTPLSDEELIRALKKCGLSHLAGQLDQDEQWARILSGGEQQRLAFARLIVNPPDIVIMDEATSALDELSQSRMMDFLRNELASATVVSVGHRPGLEIYHTREINLVRQDRGRVAQAHHRSYGPLRLLWRKLWARP